MIEIAAIKKSSELNIDTSGYQMNNYLAQVGKSPRNASIALLLAFITNLLFKTFSCLQFPEENGSHRHEADTCRKSGDR